jgi:hypothetical protein
MRFKIPCQKNKSLHMCYAESMDYQFVLSVTSLVRIRYRQLALFGVRILVTLRPAAEAPASTGRGGFLHGGYSSVG